MMSSLISISKEARKPHFGQVCKHSINSPQGERARSRPGMSPCKGALPLRVPKEAMLRHMKRRGLLHLQIHSEWLLHNAVLSGCRAQSSRFSSRCRLPIPPLVQRFISVFGCVIAPFFDEAPCPRPNDGLDSSLLSEKRRQLFGPWLLRKIPRRVGVQPLVDHPLSVPQRFGLPQSQLRILRVGARGDVGAVGQDVRPRLPRRKQDVVLEAAACLGVDFPPWPARKD